MSQQHIREFFSTNAGISYLFGTEAFQKQYCQIITKQLTSLQYFERTRREIQLNFPFELISLDLEKEEKASCFAQFLRDEFPAFGFRYYFNKHFEEFEITVTGKSLIEIETFFCHEIRYALKRNVQIELTSLLASYTGDEALNVERKFVRLYLDDISTFPFHFDASSLFVSVKCFFKNIELDSVDLKIAQMIVKEELEEMCRKLNY